MIPKKSRLNKRDTEWVLKKGEQFTTDLFIVRHLKLNAPGTDTAGTNTASACRTTAVAHQFTVITSAKLSKKAVERNSLKRKIHEAIRLNTTNPNTTNPNTAKSPAATLFKTVLIPKKRILGVKYDEIETDIKKVLKKLTRLT